MVPFDKQVVLNCDKLGGMEVLHCFILYLPVQFTSLLYAHVSVTQLPA
jgi:hypothetical protein